MCWGGKGEVIGNVENGGRNGKEAEENTKEPLCVHKAPPVIHVLPDTFS